MGAMTATKTFVMRHPVVTYFVLTFLISWGGILVVLGPGAFTGATAPTEGLLPLVYLAMFAGPTGLIVGLLWGAWHFPLFSAGDLSGALPLALFLPVQLFTFLSAYRVLMVWVYDRTGSLLVAIVMHASLTASTLILQPLDVAGMRALTYDLVLAAALWLFITALAIANGRQLSRPPLRPRMA